MLLIAYSKICLFFKRTILCYGLIYLVSAQVHSTSGASDCIQQLISKSTPQNNPCTYLSYQYAQTIYPNKSYRSRPMKSLQTKRYYEEPSFSKSYGARVQRSTKMHNLISNIPGRCPCLMSLFEVLSCSLGGFVDLVISFYNLIKYEIVICNRPI